MSGKSSGAYYPDRLSAGRLRRCYEVAPPRVTRYLQAEIDFVLGHVRPSHRVLELGCGYGRAMAPVEGRAAGVFGVDTSVTSLSMAAAALGECRFAAMDAGNLGFMDRSFDVVYCVQNGISAFGIDRNELIGESIRVAKRGGRVLFSSYSDRFWRERLEWFRIQAAEGLIGEVDEGATGNGVIVCKDGFRAETVTKDQFETLASAFGFPYQVTEVDGSSLFCVISPA
ncbi:MAG: class I SAM-dependent methyltransferase [Candidatus Latescibacterota bacterium]|jgi:2-polyprenyl-6-hydroxyphenyl methylase/3-demethylubiquinone-9 3-methyltransferase